MRSVFRRNLCYGTVSVCMSSIGGDFHPRLIDGSLGNHTKTGRPSPALAAALLPNCCCQAATSG